MEQADAGSENRWWLNLRSKTLCACGLPNRAVVRIAGHPGVSRQLKFYWFGFTPGEKTKLFTEVCTAAAVFSHEMLSSKRIHVQPYILLLLSLKPFFGKAVLSTVNNATLSTTKNAKAKGNTGLPHNCVVAFEGPRYKQVACDH